MNLSEAEEKPCQEVGSVKHKKPGWGPGKGELI